MNAIAIIKLVIQLLPLVFEAIKAVEKLIPQKGMGVEKKSMVLGIIQSTDPEAYKQAAATLSDVVDKSVGVLNQTGAFKDG